MVGPPRDVADEVCICDPRAPAVTDQAPGALRGCIARASIRNAGLSLRAASPGTRFSAHRRVEPLPARADGANRRDSDPLLLAEMPDALSSVWEFVPLHRCGDSVNVGDASPPLFMGVRNAFSSACADGLLHRCVDN